MSIKIMLSAVHQEKIYRENLRKHYNWPGTARPSQLPPPGKWTTWLILAGRGFGKTRTGSETLRQWVKEGLSRRISPYRRNRSRRSPSYDRRTVWASCRTSSMGSSPL